MPVVVLSTRFFEPLAVATAKGKGMPDIRQVILPFPYEGLPEKQVRAIARKALPAILDALTRPDAPALVRIEADGR